MVTPVRQAARAPATLWVLRIVLGLQVLAIFAQPVLAGIYLTGDVDAIGVHAGVAIGVAALTLLAVLAAVADVLGARGRWRVLGAALVLLAGVIMQVTFGFQRTLGVHVPLGVAVVTASVLFNVWVWSPAARRRR